MDEISRARFESAQTELMDTLGSWANGLTENPTFSDCEKLVAGIPPAQLARSMTAVVFHATRNLRPRRQSGTEVISD